MTPISPQIELLFKRIAPFSIIWGAFSLVFVLIEKGILGDSQIIPATGNVYHFETTLFISTLSGLLMGAIMGTIEIRYVKYWFKESPFLFKFLFKASFYIIAICLFVLITALAVNSLKLNQPFYSEVVFQSILTFTNRLTFWSIILYAALVISITLFISELTENLGTSIIINFFLGRYHRAKEESRIFMFLDMRSSTTIAEKLGHKKYFRLLKEYYDVLNRSILKYHGEIYQYVGDEVVISWPAHRKEFYGIDCFNHMKNEFSRNKTQFIEKYGLVPEFKAGLHYGTVMTGKIGEIQKSVLFTGDVLNTTARIQSKCNDLEVDLLISKELAGKYGLQDRYDLLKIEKPVAIRGRTLKMELYSL